jgi:hypothetical protein
MIISDSDNVNDNKLPSFDFDKFDKKFRDSIFEDLNIKAEDIEDVKPCTPLQTGLISQFLRSGKLYVNHITFLFHKSLQVPTIQQAWDVLIRRHSILRTGFTSIDDPDHEFAMVTYAPTRKAIKSVYTTENVQPGPDGISRWRTNSTFHFHQQLHLPPWRALLSGSDSGTMMHLTLFHALYDAQSLHLILEDLLKVCNGQFLTKTPPLNPVINAILSGSNQRSIEKASNSQSDRKFWRNELGDNIPINKFPNLTPLRSATNQTEVAYRLSSKDMGELEQGCREAGISLQAAGQAAWCRVLAAYLGESAVTFGVVLSGRDTIPDGERCVFPCITTVPIVVQNISDDRMLVQNIMDFNARVRRHQFSPMQDIQRWIGRPNEALFDTIFAFQKLSTNRNGLPWTVLEEVATDEVSV